MPYAVQALQAVYLAGFLSLSVALIEQVRQHMARTIHLCALGSRINKNGYVVHKFTLGCRTLCSQLLNLRILSSHSST